MSDEAFDLPDLRERKQVAVRLTDKFRQDLNVLMTVRRASDLSDIIRWAVAQQADPVRQSWQEGIDRRAKEEDDG